jgi:hypothetical protein
MADKIIEIVLALLAVALTRYAVPAIRAYLKSKNSEQLEQLISELVTAAEQLIQGSGQGEKKLAYVEEMLNAQGIEMTDSVRAKVEAAVYKISN